MLVETPEVFQRLHAGLPTGAVTTAVQSLTIAIWLRDETFGGQPWTAKVTARQSGTAQIQLAGNARGTELQFLIKDATHDVGQGATNR
ncbi:hypothetical protein D3C77_318310 [compost metagenome]